MAPTSQAAASSHQLPQGHHYATSEFDPWNPTPRTQAANLASGPDADYARRAHDHAQVIAGIDDYYKGKGKGGMLNEGGWQHYVGNSRAPGQSERDKAVADRAQTVAGLTRLVDLAKKGQLYPNLSSLNAEHISRIQHNYINRHAKSLEEQMTNHDRLRQRLNNDYSHMPQTSYNPRGINMPPLPHVDKNIVGKPGKYDGTTS